MNVLETVEKLIALTGSPSKEEARTSAEVACNLIRKHGLRVVGPNGAAAAGASSSSTSSSAPRPRGSDARGERWYAKPFWQNVLMDFAEAFVDVSTAHAHAHAEAVARAPAKKRRTRAAPDDEELARPARGHRRMRRRPLR